MYFKAYLETIKYKLKGVRVLKGFIKGLFTIIVMAGIGYLVGNYFFDEQGGIILAIFFALSTLSSINKEVGRKSRIQKDAKYMAEALKE